jgi:hypothetical protein
MLTLYINFCLGNFAQKSGCVWYLRNEFPLSSFTTGIGIHSLNFICWCVVFSVGKVMHITLQFCVVCHCIV